MTEQITHTSNLQLQNNLNGKASNKLTMAWAQRLVDGHVVHISELTKAENGKKSGCICPSCKLNLIAANAGQKQRHHFKHPMNSQSDVCLVMAARFAAKKMLEDMGEIDLPDRKYMAELQGFGGHIYQHQLSRGVEKISFKNVAFEDSAFAKLVLDDGRILLVRLTASVAFDSASFDFKVARSEGQIAVITIDINDPELAGMDVNELRSRLVLLVDNACWERHWSDDVFKHEASDLLQKQAWEYFDWIDDETAKAIAISGLNQSETLLHAEVKRILTQAKTLNLPEINMHQLQYEYSMQIAMNRWSFPSSYVSITAVELEVAIDNIRPDATVICTGKIMGEDEQLLIEVTVTNTISDERIGRIKKVNLPSLEIDLRKHNVEETRISRTNLESLVIHSLSMKRWLHHPRLALEIAKVEKLQIAIQLELQRSEQANERLRANEAVEAKVQELVWLQKTPSELAEFYLKLILKRVKPSLTPMAKSAIKKQEFLILKALDRLGHHVAKELMDSSQMENVLRRLLCLKLKKAIGFEGVSHVLQDIQQHTNGALQWNTVYLFAAKVYGASVALNTAEIVRFNKWRKYVWRLVQRKDERFFRNLRYDNFLSFLFPEIAENLKFDRWQRSAGYSADATLRYKQLNDPQGLHFDTQNLENESDQSISNHFAKLTQDKRNESEAYLKNTVLASELYARRRG